MPDHEGPSLRDGLPLANLGEEVRRRRSTLGIRQADLADMAGCSERFVHTVENGKTTLRLDKLLDVLEVLGLRLTLTLGRGAKGVPEVHEPPRNEKQ